MRTAYIDYSMSVIVSRAIPDVRDGLKPVHRRVLYGMYELGVLSHRAYKKSARVVGEVLGKYHPHGDVAVYDAMVRMGQEWSLRYPLVEGQGNFGSVDGDSPAAMRYTEVRLQKLAEEILSDIRMQTVDYQPNFDDSLEEPVVMPSRIPNLLLNGSSGIAVGMATNMPPHNMREVIDALVAYIDNSEISVEELMDYVKAPDFPTGGIIYGVLGVREAFLTGRGRVVLRGKAEIEEEKGRSAIVVSEIPFMVNKALMIERTAELISAKKIEGISDLRDESDRDGLRVVYELKKEAIPQVVLNNLYKQTPLQTSFGVNNVALVKGKPQVLNLKDLLVHYVEHRHDVLLRKLRFELKENERRLHILEGFLLALDHLDEFIRLIRQAATPEEAKQNLMSTHGLSDDQSTAILKMPLRQLTGLEREKLRKEHDEVKERVSYLQSILASRDLQMDQIKTDLLEIGEKYGDERRTQIDEYGEDFTMEDVIPNDRMVITISKAGYMKRTILGEYKVQGRGGVGSRGVSLKED
ncbi:MAG: DNA topoisomerase 4 subunit A, partial [Cytophagales bacterium]|nr:DNA topoisomerase 4 subunit A [Cytophagales bacterium]